MGYWADEDVNHFVLSQLLSDRERAHGKDMEGGGEVEFGRRTGFCLDP